MLNGLDDIHADSQMETIHVVAEAA